MTRTTAETGIGFHAPLNQSCLPGENLENAVAVSNKTNLQFGGIKERLAIR